MGGERRCQEGEEGEKKEPHTGKALGRSKAYLTVAAALPGHGVLGDLDKLHRWEAGMRTKAHGQG